MNHSKDEFRDLIQRVKAADSGRDVPRELINEAASANISLSGDSAAEVQQLMQMFKNAGMENADTVANTIGSMPPMDDSPCDDDCDGGAPGDIGQKIELPMKKSLPALADDMEASFAEDGYDNAPDENYQDSEFMNNTLAGGINKPKKSFAPSARGDSPMAVEDDQYESIKTDLYSTLRSLMSEESKKGKKPDFLDVDKDGNKKEPFKKALKDKKSTTESKKGKKPDFLDVDKDGNKKETFKKALKDKKSTTECKTNEKYKPHMMYDQKTGKSKMAKVEQDHKDLAKKGWSHKKPTVKEVSKYKTSKKKVAEADTDTSKAEQQAKRLAKVYAPDRFKGKSYRDNKTAQSKKKTNEGKIDYSAILPKTEVITESADISLEHIVALATKDVSTKSKGKQSSLALDLKKLAGL
jgi:hypothetical protein